MPGRGRPPRNPNPVHDHDYLLAERDEYAGLRASYPMYGRVDLILEPLPQDELDRELQEFPGLRLEGPIDIVAELDALAQVPDENDYDAALGERVLEDVHETVRVHADRVEETETGYRYLSDLPERVKQARRTPRSPATGPA